MPIATGGNGSYTWANSFEIRKVPFDKGRIGSQNVIESRVKSISIVQTRKVFKWAKEQD